LAQNINLVRVALSVLAGGQSLLSRKSELQADEAYATTMKTYTDIEAVLKHLDKQDEKIYELQQLIKAQTDSILSIVQDLAKDTTQEGNTEHFQDGKSVAMICPSREPGLKIAQAISMGEPNLSYSAQCLDKS
jgi:hypothetical protein